MESGLSSLKIDLSGQCAIVAGGGGGIGRGCALALVAAGASVTLVDISQKAIDQVRADAEAAGDAQPAVVLTCGTKGQ